ncbi:MAG: AcrB/AcrD/AcrF family protein, partial [Thermoprotei archaeon]
MKPTKFALDRPVTILMAFLAVIIIGFISLQRLSLELLPRMNYPQITILTSYENVSPSEIESLISKPIEEGVGTAKGVKRITSISKEGLSLVTLDYAWGVDTNLSVLDVREKVDLLKDSLPKEAGNPIIIKFDPSSHPVMTLGISGHGELAELTRIASDKIKQRLERIEGVALARISGAVEREILISVDQGRLFAYGIPISSVVESLKSANFNFPGGKIEKAKGVVRIRTMGQFESLKDLEKVVVAKGMGKAPVFLRDVATIRDSFKERASSFMINGERSVGISIFKQADSNTVQIADNVLREVERLNRELNPGVNIVVVYNQAQFIKDSISDLKWAGILGGIFAFLVLLLFLHSFRSALIITTAIPISVLGSFALMYMTGISLNLMSLGGLALAVGLLVDNGIVILENIHRHKKDIPTLYEAAIVGAEEMHNPVIASTLAHIIVFLPIVFVKGLAGNFFTQLALTISFSLLMSILVALMLNPVLEARRITFSQISTDSHRSFESPSASSRGIIWSGKLIGIIL